MAHAKDEIPMLPRCLFFARLVPKISASETVGDEYCGRIANLTGFSFTQARLWIFLSRLIGGKKCANGKGNEHGSRGTSPVVEKKRKTVQSVFLT